MASSKSTTAKVVPIPAPAAELAEIFDPSAFAAGAWSQPRGKIQLHHGWCWEDCRPCKESGNTGHQDLTHNSVSEGAFDLISNHKGHSKKLRGIRLRQEILSQRPGKKELCFEEGLDSDPGERRPAAWSPRLPNPIKHL